MLSPRALLDSAQFPDRGDIVRRVFQSLREGFGSAFEISFILEESSDLSVRERVVRFRAHCLAVRGERLVAFAQDPQRAA